VSDVRSCTQERYLVAESFPAASDCRLALLTISVDDGHVSDLWTAELLWKFGLKATFYIPRTNPERAVITQRQLQELAKNFEVGGHTLSHTQLPALEESRAWEEIRGCKDWLEDVLGRPVQSFCYPRGKYNRRIRELVKRAGFLGARTCRYNLNSLPQDAFQAGVSTEAFSHSVAVHLRHALVEGNYEGFVDFFRIHDLATDWETHFRRALDWVESNGGIAHLYLHSWQIEDQNAWQKLERVLQDASARKGMIPVTNADLFRLVTASATERAG
jgi:peptidoglycan-N-acetylglucosamine deacetylase